MKFDDYQKQAMKIVFGDQETYLVQVVLGLVGEAGEVADKFKKWYRDGDGKDGALDKEEITKELGDVLWHLTAIADKLGVDLESVAEANLEKLSSRKKRGTLGGDGDNR